MQKKQIELFDSVALLEDISQRGLDRGEVGTVVELLAPEVFEVEVSDDEGQTYAQFALLNSQIIALHNQGEGLKTRSMNALFYKDNTQMIFGDAKKVVDEKLTATRG